MPKRISLCAVALLFLSGCEQVQETVDPAPRAEDTAAAFLEAWSASDEEAMVAEMAEGEWTTDELGALFVRVEETGRIPSWDVALDGTVEQPSDEALLTEGAAAETVAPYRITYESEAASEPVTFDGELQLTYDASEERWVVGFSKQHLWPEHTEARSFGVEESWPVRAAILDRTGKKLATGRDESRRYPFGSLAGTTVGHLEPSQDFPDRFQGGSGLELALDETLAGTPTQKLVLLGAKPRGCGRPPSKKKKEQEVARDCERNRVAVVGRIAGERGRDVKTTLDVAVQRAAENAYGSTTGGSVVMDPETGDLLAVVSSSPFDPGNYVGIGGIEPFNRALSGLYPPGSSLKVMTGAAALEEGVVKENTTLSGPAEYKGVRNFESGEFGSLSFATAVQESVNTAFAQIAEDLGPRRLTRYSKAFGFNRPPAMPLPAATSSFPFPADEGDVMWSSIGQAQVLASPLQMATIAATIANDGKRMEPRILMKDPEQGERVVSKKVAATMTRLMENVVTGGTGTGANIAGAQVAGKTGTAEVDVDGKRKNHAWFISFAPSSGPKVAVSVVSELGGIGGQVAAPLAGRILANVLPLVK